MQKLSQQLQEKKILQKFLATKIISFHYVKICESSTTNHLTFNIAV